MHRDVDHHLVDRIGQPTNGALRQRNSREQPLGALAEAQVDLRHHPDRGALVDGEIGGSLASSGISWTAVAPVPMTAIWRPGGVVVVLPLGGVDDLALEGLDARDLRAPSAATGSRSR